MTTVTPWWPTVLWELPVRAWVSSGDLSDLLYIPSTRRHPDSPIWATSRHGCQNWWLRSWHVQHQPRGRGAAEEDVTHGTPATRQTYPTGDHLGSHTLHTDATKQTQYEGALNEEDVNSKYFVYKIVKIPHRYII